MQELYPCLGALFWSIARGKLNGAFCGNLYAKNGEKQRPFFGSARTDFGVSKAALFYLTPTPFFNLNIRNRPLKVKR